MIKQGIEKIFDGVEDKRSKRNRKHPFISLIGISLLGALGGIDSFNGLGDFAKCKEKELKEFFDLLNGAPSHDTFQRLFDAIHPDEFLENFSLFTQSLKKGTTGGIIALDGKMVKGSFKNNPLTIVSAWCEQNELVLGQVKVGQDSSEIPAINTLLSLIDITGRTITIDAIGCQRDICEKIVEKEGDYVIALKGNQKNLHENVKAYFQQEQKYPSWLEYDKGHGRIEKRLCYATDDIDFLHKEHSWPGLKSIAKVVSTRIIKEKETTETRYYISSLPANPELICKAARAHWGVENKLHWRLDVVFNEDKAGIRNDNAAENMDIMRKWALNTLSPHKGKSSIKSLQRHCLFSFDFLKSLLEKTFHA